MKSLKSNNIFELDPERLATTDEHGHRVYLYPEDVKGLWKSRRKVFYRFLILIYLFLPWIYFNGKPAFMIDIIHREFTFLGFTLHGVEPILFFLIAASGLAGIAFLVSSLGRVWCGWACPQTVFIQEIFMRVEALVEGKAKERRELDKAPWTMGKVLKRSIKWLLFIIISLHISHTFIGYFVGPRELFFITMNGPSEHLGLFVATMTFTLITLLDFGWFREQFCIIACPYGRIQSVLMDENSLVVSYNAKRGEPRRGSTSAERPDEGDCINCYNCVKVCPTGIDIRRGTQLECIACTQCIDACDDIMTKLKKPKGLIGYSSETELNGHKRKKITKRSFLYITTSVLFMLAFIYFLGASTKLQLVFLRGKTPFQMIESGQRITNQFTLKMSHQGEQHFKIYFKVKEVELKNLVQIITPVQPVLINTSEKKIVLFFKFSPEILKNGTRKISVEAFDEISHQTVATKEAVLVGPTH